MNNDNMIWWGLGGVAVLGLGYWLWSSSAQAQAQPYNSPAVVPPPAPMLQAPPLPVAASSTPMPGVVRSSDSPIMRAALGSWHWSGYR